MKLRPIIFFECDYCGLTDTKKEYVRNHERGCYLNPKTRACPTCINACLGENRHGHPIAECINDNKKYDLSHCLDWKLNQNIDKRIIDEFTFHNAQSLSNYL